MYGYKCKYLGQMWLVYGFNSSSLEAEAGTGLRVCCQAKSTYQVPGQTKSNLVRENCLYSVNHVLNKR